MSNVIALSDAQWPLVADLFDPPGRRGPRARYRRPTIVEAMLFIGRTGVQWRYLPERYPPWSAVWKQWSRWRDHGVWELAMTRLAATIRTRKGRAATPSKVMLDAQTARGARYGPTFHQAGGRGGRTIGTKRVIAVEIEGLPVAVAGASARPHDVAGGRRMLQARLPELPRLSAVVADRGYRGMAPLAARQHLARDIKAKPAGTTGFTPLAPLYKIEQVFAQLGRWRRLARCYEGSPASARAWLAVAAVGLLA